MFLTLKYGSEHVWNCDPGCEYFCDNEPTELSLQSSDSNGSGAPQFLQGFAATFGYRKKRKLQTIVFSGPGVEGVAPREASDRLQVFQAQFDELWRKYITYSGGEELFGLTVKGTCPVKQRVPLPSEKQNIDFTVINSL